MGRLRHINLEDTPWPISILKFNQAISRMRPGDHIIAFLKDADVMTNIEQLLRHQPDVEVMTSTPGSEYCIEVKKPRQTAHRDEMPTSHKYP